MESKAKFVDHILRVTTKDEIDNLESAKKFSKELFENCLRNSCSKILVEHGFYSDSYAEDDFDLLAEYHAHIMPSIISMAVLSSEDNLYKCKLWENSCIRRGANVKVFTEEESAVKWLKQNG